MGFDYETKDGSWRFLVRGEWSLKRSVKFNLPLEGVNSDFKRQETTTLIPTTKLHALKSLLRTSNTQKAEGNGSEGKSDYVSSMLREGAGITGEKTKNMSPKGMQIWLTLSAERC